MSQCVWERSSVNREDGVQITCSPLINLQGVRAPQALGCLLILGSSWTPSFVPPSPKPWPLSKTPLVLGFYSLEAKSGSCRAGWFLAGTWEHHKITNVCPDELGLVPDLMLKVLDSQLVESMDYAARGLEFKSQLHYLPVVVCFFLIKGLLGELGELYKGTWIRT